MPDIETGFEGGHGSHWDAAIEEPTMLQAIIAAAYKRGQAHEVAGAAPSVRLRTLPLGDKGFELRILEIPSRSGEKPAIATAYPHLSTVGKALAVTPVRVIEWGNHGLEAEVEVELEGGARVTFFATDYFARSRDYRSAEKVEVRFSAVAYTLGVISPEPKYEDVDGRQVNVSRASMIVQLKDSERAPYYDDDFFLQGPTVKVETFAYPPWDEAAVVRIEVPELGAVPVFGRKKAFPHGWPRLGEFVAAYSWMQGRIS